MQFLLVFLAIAIGWWLGRRSRAPQEIEAITGLASQQYQGLNYLLNDRSDAALDAFIDALEVNDETLETHIAVGNLMRRKGEVERAIRIHQNLLARPSLQRQHLHQAHLELARDYISAGLLDRAEKLLQDLLSEAPELAAVALQHLVEIYQDEREWQQAIAMARQLLPKKSLFKPAKPVAANVQAALANFYCELVEGLVSQHDFRGARSQLTQALAIDANCVRASLLLADVEYQTGHYKKALQALWKVADQDPVFIPETVPLAKACYHLLADQRGFYDYLLASLERYPAATIMLALVADLQGREGDEVAADFIATLLKRNPSLRGLAKLIELHIAGSQGRAQQNLSLLQALIEQLVSSKPQYQCQHCGFSGKRLHWLCPGCKHWGQVKPIRGAEGE